jgi:hypothetical protein
LPKRRIVDFRKESMRGDLPTARERGPAKRSPFHGIEIQNKGGDYERREEAKKIVKY